ncbi:MAG: nitroreductase [Rhizobiaceae bacterium]
MNEAAIEFLLSRKSAPISVIHEPAPSNAELAGMIRIATRVPDHGLLEPWRFIVYRGDVRRTIGAFFAERVAEIEGSITEQRAEQERARFTRAPLVVGVVSVPKEHPRIPDWEKFISGGNAAFALVLAAHAYGYNANWVSNWYSDDAPSRAFLGLSPDERAIGFVHIGTVDVKIPDRPRPEPSAVTSDYAGPWKG